MLDAEVAKERPSAEADAADVVETLDPWPEPVNGAALAEEVRALLRAHVVFASPTDADALTIWIVGTYGMGAWRLWPKVLISSPTKRCGKTTLLEVIEALVFRAMMCSNITAAALFRSIEKWKPTLLVDEADRFLRGKDELNGIVNAGHTRRTAYVNRCVEVNGEQDVRRYSVWCPQVFAGIGSQADTLVDRSIVISLRRRLPDEAIERLPFDLHERMLATRRQIVRWVADNASRVGAMDAEPPECGNDRRRDNYTPLWRIAHVLGGEWPARISAAYAAHRADDEDEPEGILLLRDLAGFFEARRAERLQSADLVGALVDLEDRPWAAWNHGRPLTPQSMARLLRPFAVRPRNSKAGGHVTKSYFAEDVRVACDRYAAKPVFSAATPLPR